MCKKIVGLVLLSVVTIIFGQNSSRVTYAAVIFRHGDRTPVEPYPTDPWQNESFWPVKFGELTNIGKLQHYQFGKMLRSRYAHLLSDYFDPDEVYVRSTDVDRTLMSAQAHLAGLYPPVGNAVWDNGLMWQPVPVHTIPHHMESLLAMGKECPAYNHQLRKLKSSSSYTKRLQKYKSLMEFLQENSGTKINDYNKMEYIYSTLSIERENNFSLPNWTDSVYPDQLREPACYSFGVPTSTPVLARLKVGPLVKEITMKLLNASDYPSKRSPLKLSLYSAHDDTIGDLLNGLRLFDGNCPVFTAAIFVELVFGSDARYLTPLVRISYRNTTGIEEPHLLSIPQCGEECPLEKFLLLYQDLITVDWENECQIKHPMMISILLFFTILLLLMFFINRTYYNSFYTLGNLRRSTETLDEENNPMEPMHPSKTQP